MISTGDMTTKEKYAVEELKERTLNHVTPKMLEDESIFYRFCKARDFNVKNAEVMLLKHIAYRKEYQIDTILEDYQPPEVLTKYVTTSYIGFDKEGCLVRYLDVGNFDSIAVFRVTKKMNLHKLFFREMEVDAEMLKQHSKEIGKQVTKIVAIFNLENISLSQVTHKQSIETLLYFCHVLQDNYPERIKQVVLINSPACISIIFALIRNVLVSSIMEKIRCYGTDDWKEHLLEMIDADVLPKFLGGNRTDPDGNPLCKAFIKHGRPIPRSYYLPSHKKKISLPSDAEKFIIARSSKEEVNFIVEKPGSHLEWEFETKSKDIGFSMYFKENSLKNSKPAELIPNQRIDTSFEPEKGFYKCEKVGIYTIVFDNSYSWMHSKEVYCRARLVVPN